MTKVYVEFDTEKKIFYNGSDFVQAMRVQAELLKKYKNDKRVRAIGYEH